MKQLFLPILLLLINFTLTAQTWDGGGGANTDWNEPLNWDNDMVPAAGDVVIIASNVTITGTAPNNPSRIQINSNSTVTLALDITIDDAVNTNHALKLQGNSVLNLGTGNGETFTIHAPTNRDGVQHNATGAPATINIAANTTLNITQARDGILVDAGGGNIINNAGTIVISNVDQDGIDNSGNFNNNLGGSITINDANSNGINNKAGVFNNFGDININNATGTTIDGINTSSFFNNQSTGVITVNKADEDGVEILGGSNFINDGELNVISEDNPSADNNGISVGSDLEAGNLTNNGTINGDGGIGTTTNSRSIYIYSMGTMTNTMGAVINLMNGNDVRILYVTGTFTNEKGGVLDLTDRRARVEFSGILTNNSLILSTYPGTGIFVNNAGTAINNAFYDFAGSQFSAGAGGTSTDNGIDISQNPIIVDAGGSCIADIAEVPCVWFYNGTPIDNTPGADGSQDLPTAFFMTDPAIITNNDIPNYPIEIQLQNFCLMALPVEWVSFDIKKNERSVSLTWKTASEINNEYFIIERSIDSQHFTALDKVDGNGTTNSINTYSFEDYKPLPGTSYYRIAQVDIDGQTSYSEIKSITNENTPLSFAVFPTQLSRGNALNIDLTSLEEGNYQITAYDIKGSVVVLGNAQGGTTSTISDINLSKGMYFIGVQNKSEMLLQKLIIE